MCLFKKKNRSIDLEKGKRIFLSAKEVVLLLIGIMLRSTGIAIFRKSWKIYG